MIVRTDQFEMRVMFERTNVVVGDKAAADEGDTRH